MATTVKELIKYLQTVENQDQPVIYQYYLAEHFEVSDKKFSKAVDDLDDESLWDEAYQTLKDYLN
jgi:hypothetical protein